MRKFAFGRTTWRGAVCLTGLLALGGCGLFSMTMAVTTPLP